MGKPVILDIIDDVISEKFVISNFYINTKI